MYVAIKVGSKKQAEAAWRLRGTLEAWRESVSRSLYRRALLLWEEGHRIQRKFRIPSKVVDRLIDDIWNREAPEVSEVQLEAFYRLLRR